MLKFIPRNKIHFYIVIICGFMVGVTLSVYFRSPDAAANSPIFGTEPLLKMENMTCKSEHGFITIEGDITNISEMMLRNVIGVAMFKDEKGTLIRLSTAMIENELLRPGQKSPFGVAAITNRAIKTCQVEFKTVTGQLIPSLQ